MFTRIIIVAAIITPVAVGQEWTRFRGPNGTGQSEAGTVPATWNVSEYNWVVDLPGGGHSSPVVWGQRLFVQSADTESGKQHVLCIDTASGNLIWHRAFDSSKYHIHTRNSFASSSPAVDESLVYVTWATPEKISLFALEHDGTTAWSREDLGPFASQHGYGSSPIVAGDLVILSNLQMPSERGTETSSVTALNKATGATVWSTPRTSGKTSYSVPCLRNQDGRTELILCSTTHGMFALDLATGVELWAVKDAFSMRTVSSPVIAGNIVFGSTGSGGGGNYVAAIDMDRRQVAYKIDRQAPYVPTVVTNGDLAFLWYDKGIVTCIDIQSGKQHWSERIGGNYSGSPVRVGDRIYCIAEDGQVVALAASQQYKLLGKTALGQDSRSTPAIANGTMYLRTFSKLFNIGG